MTRHAWSALVLSTVLAMTGCGKPAANDAHAVGTDDAEVKISENVDGPKVAMAVGRALAKGFSSLRAGKPDNTSSTGQSVFE